MENLSFSDGRGPRERVEALIGRARGRARVAVAGTVGIGVLVALLLGASRAGGGQLQDPAISQLRQEINTLKISINNRLGIVESQVGQHQRQLLQLDRRLRDVEQAQRDVALLPRRDLPVPVAQELLDVRALRAERFLLRDDEGGVRATLALPDGRPVLTLLDGEGREMVVLGVTEEGTAVLRLRDAEGNLRPVALQ